MYFAPTEEMLNDQQLEDIMGFIEQVYEIAFGDDAFNKGYDRQEVLDKLREFSDKALEEKDV